MGLVYPAYWKGLQDPFMHPLALEGFFLIKWAFILIDHNPVVMQGIIAIPVKFFSKQSFTRSEGIR